MRVQIADKRIVKDTLTVWPELVNDVDQVIDIVKFPFAPASLHAVYSFNALSRLTITEALEAIAAWKKTLVPDGKLYIVVDDFEFLARSHVGGDLPLSQINGEFIAKSYWSHEGLIEILAGLGFNKEQMRIWYKDNPEFPKKPYELVMEISNV